MKQLFHQDFLRALAYLPGVGLVHLGNNLIWPGIWI